MPYQIIKTTEYECIRCGYKWITRKNGVDSNPNKLPRFCPFCKTSLWNQERSQRLYMSKHHRTKPKADEDRMR
ncbi:MAG: hypothetical protein ACJ71A_06115, partial [Nitrososphaeraceae archaeon]